MSRRDGGAIDGYERSICPIAMLINRPGDQFFARSGISANQYRDRFSRDPANFLVNSLHRAAIPYNGIARGSHFPKFHRLGHHPAARDCFFRQLDQLLHLERFKQIIERSELGRLNGGFGGSMRRHKNNRHSRFCRV